MEKVAVTEGDYCTTKSNKYNNLNKYLLFSFAKQANTNIFKLNFNYYNPHLRLSSVKI